MQKGKNLSSLHSSLPSRLDSSELKRPLACHACAKREFRTSCSPAPSHSCSRPAAPGGAPKSYSSREEVPGTAHQEALQPEGDGVMPRSSLPRYRSDVLALPVTEWRIFVAKFTDSDGREFE